MSGDQGHYQRGYEQGLADRQREEFHQGYKEAYGGQQQLGGTDGQRHKGMGEKAKEAVGLDPKDGRDPKDAGYNAGYSQDVSGGQGIAAHAQQQQQLQQPRERRGSSSSSSSSDEEGRGGPRADGTTRRKKGMGEKIKEKIGLDPKDGRDPKDAGYTGSSSSTTTGYNQGSSTGSSYGQQGVGSTTGTGTGGYNQSGYDNTQGYTGGSQSAYGTDNTQYSADGQRKKGMGEKAKEAVGLDPKDGQGDPKDVGYTNQSGSSSSYGQQGIGSSTGYGQPQQQQQQQGGTGYNTTGSTTGYEQQSTSYVQPTQGSYGQGSATGYDQGPQLAVEDSSSETHRKKGLGEKIKEKLGMDHSKDTPPQDGDYQTNTYEGRAY